MNHKGFANIALIVIVVVLVGAVGYFALRKPTIEPTIKNTDVNATILGKFSYICPVERPKSSCLVSTASLTARILMYTSPSNNSYLEIARVPLDTQGQFRFEVPAGSYTVDIISYENQKTISSQHSVVVKSGEIININLIEVSP